jgi:hypothetical protein
MTGPIRVTIQGTDENGRHIITAKGSPLSVEESGDVVIGTPPEDAPTIDQWQQAYAQAMSAANAAQSAANVIDDRIGTIVDDVTQRILETLSLPIATRESLGGVIVGDNISVDENGVISVAQQSGGGSGMTVEQARALVNLSRLAYYAFDSEFDNDGLLKANAMLKRVVMPYASTEGVGAVKVDGITVTIADDGTISASPYELPTASAETLGGVRVDGISVAIDANGALFIPTATPASLGLVKPAGVTISIDNGMLTATGSGSGSYSLPKATNAQLGGIKVGNGLSVDSDGVLSVDIAFADGMEF